MDNTKLVSQPPVDQDVLADATRPWSGCGTQQDITGCRFSLNVMADDYARTILSALDHVDTSRVWTTTDLWSSVYRGKRVDVLDAFQAFVCAAHAPSTHIVVEATFSKGCPGDVDQDATLPTDDLRANADRLATDPVCQVKYFLAPMGAPDYMTHIAYAVNLAIKRGLYTGYGHYVSMLEGTVTDIVAYFNEVMAYCEKTVGHYIMEATLSFNSPSLTTKEAGHAA